MTLATDPALEMFAVAAPGLEAVVQAELVDLGVAGRVEPGGVAWTGSAGDLYRANLWLRTASRVLVRVARFRARSFIELERHARKIAWSPYLPEGSAVEIHVTSRKSKLYHESAIAERLARWIGEDAGAAVGRAGGEEGADEEGTDNGGQRFLARFVRDECIVSADASGGLLHRRGYRQALGKAPLRETLGAAMLLAAGWRSESPLLDPLCGSGTIPVEAALLARRIPPGLAGADREPREYAFTRWPSFQPELWANMVAAARAQVESRAPIEIHASDRDPGAIEAAVANAMRAGVAADIRFETRPLSDIDPPQTAGLLATNPPYGVRVGDAARLRDLYAALGKLVRTRLSGWQLTLLADDDALARQIGIPLREVLRTRNGGIPVKLLTSLRPD